MKRCLCSLVQSFMCKNSLNLKNILIYILCIKISQKWYKQISNLDRHAFYIFRILSYANLRVRDHSQIHTHNHIDYKYSYITKFFNCKKEFRYTLLLLDGSYHLYIPGNILVNSFHKIMKALNFHLCLQFIFNFKNYLLTYLIDLLFQNHNFMESYSLY
jgi:hypothetical protein